MSESDISVQGHGVHTAYDEMATALEARSDVTVIRGGFGERVDCDIYHLHTIGAKTYSRMLQRTIPRVVSVHVVPDSFIGSIMLAKYWLFFARWYMGIYYRRADKLLAVSKMVADTLENELRVPKEKIEVFYNTVDMQSFAPSKRARQFIREKLEVRESDFVVVGVGQVQPRKRFDIFVRMATELPDTTFVWCGGIPFQWGGADFTEMQNLIKRAPKNLHVTGIISHEEVKAYLSAADAFCLPAEQENHPMAVLEAAGAGLPIILRDIREYDDTFQDDIIRCSDETFSDAVNALRQKPSVRDQYKNAAARIAKRFDSREAAARLVKIYGELVK